MRRIDFIFPVLAKIPGRLPMIAGHALRFYLCLTMLGCAGTRPRPTVTQSRDIETHVVLTDDRTLFQACVGVLQDMGYTVDLADHQSGLLTATRQTQERSGEISDEPQDPHGKGMPTWGKVMLVITGVFLVVLVVAALRSDDEKEKKDDKDKQDDKDQDKQDEPNPERRFKDDGKKKHHHGGHRHDGNRGSNTIVVHDQPGGPSIYRYQVTISMSPAGEGGMRVRASVQGQESRGGVVLKVGRVDDPSFFHDFFSGLHRSLDIEEGAPH